MIQRTVFLLCIFCFPLVASAIGNFKPTASQLKLLPDYCKPRATTWGNNRNDPRVQRWYAIFGSDWIRMHHYCAGLNYINQGDRNFNNRERFYKLAIGEFSYVEKGAEKGGKKSVLLPMLYTKKGDAYAGLRNTVAAERYYRKSITGYPQYSSAYKRLVNLLIRSNRFNEAQTINNLGLKRFSKSKSKSKFFIRKKTKIEQGLAQKQTPPPQ